MTRLKLLLSTALLISVITFGQIKPEDIKIDLGITRFKLANNMGGMLGYCPNGKSDLIIGKNPSSFSINTKPNMTYDLSVSYIEFQINYAERHGSVVTELLKKDTTIDGYKAFEATFTEQRKGFPDKRYNYYAFFLKESTAVIFLSGDSDGGKYIQKLKTTFRKAKI